MMPPWLAGKDNNELLKKYRQIINFVKRYIVYANFENFGPISEVL